MKYKIKLFGFLPIGHCYKYHNKTKYYLFGVLLLTIKETAFNGYDNIWTREIYKHCKCGKNLYCGDETHLWSNNCELGNHVCFNGCEVRGNGFVKIGSHFHSGKGLLVLTSNHNYDGGKHIPYSPNDNIDKKVIIEDGVWCGARVTILPRTHIGEGAIIQGGAVVHGNIPPLAIVGGNPAVVIKYRNKEHWEECKQKQMWN